MNFSQIFGSSSYQTSAKIHIDITGFSSLSAEGILAQLLENAKCNGQISNITANGEKLEFNNRKLGTVAILYTMNLLGNEGKKYHIFRVYVLNQLTNELLEVDEL